MAKLRQEDPGNHNFNDGVIHAKMLALLQGGIAKVARIKNGLKVIHCPICGGFGHGAGICPLKKKLDAKVSDQLESPVVFIVWKMLKNLARYRRIQDSLPEQHGANLGIPAFTLRANLLAALNDHKTTED